MPSPQPCCAPLLPGLAQPRREVLGNGNQIVSLAIEGAPLVCLDFWCRAGSAFETEAESGLAHFLEHMVFKGSEALAAVVEEFGRDVLAADGSLDRPKLGRIVFADDAKRRRLMSITFPAIGRLLLERFAVAEAAGAPVLVYESALLVENGQADAWRPLVVVTTTPEIQLRRLRERNALTGEEALDRVRSQMPLADKARLADFVIENVGTPAQTRSRCAEVWAALIDLARP